MNASNLLAPVGGSKVQTRSHRVQRGEMNPRSAEQGGRQCEVPSLYPEPGEQGPAVSLSTTWARYKYRHPLSRFFRTRLRMVSTMDNPCCRGCLLHLSTQPPRLSVRYCHQDLHWGQAPPRLTPIRIPCLPRAPLLTAEIHPAAASDRNPRLGIVHFRGWFIRLVSCYTLRATLPTSMARFQLS